MSERTEFQTYDHQDVRAMSTFGDGGAPLNDSGIKPGDQLFPITSALQSSEATRGPQPKTERIIEAAHTARP